MKRSLIFRLLPLFFFIISNGMYAQEENPYEGNPISDIDGNVYKIVMTQQGVWLAENLRTTKFNDGTAIPLIQDLKAWKEMKSPAYGWFSDDAGYRNTFGALYNWYAVETDKLCPAGWHVPSEVEWNEILDYAGGNERSGDSPAKLKEAGTTHWKSPNEGATNEIYFTALPTGEVSYFYADEEPGTKTHWWTATEDTNVEPGSTAPPTNAEIVGLSHNFHSKTAGTFEKESFLPIRCIMDSEE